MNRHLVYAQSRTQFLQPQMLLGDIQRSLDEGADRQPIHAADCGRTLRVRTIALDDARGGSLANVCVGSPVDDSAIRQISRSAAVARMNCAQTLSHRRI